MRIVITSLLLTFTWLSSAQSLLQPGFDPVEYNDPVSYTHLDVYKRQDQGTETVEALEEELKKTGSIFLWWD